MGGLFNPKTPQAPAPAPPPAVEDAPVQEIPTTVDTPRKRIARKKTAAERTNRRLGGRQSTILTSSDKLGG